MARTRLVCNLAPLADIYVCEAIAAAHRSAPSLVGFAEALPAAGGRLFVDELMRPDPHQRVACPTVRLCPGRQPHRRCL